MSPRIGVHGIDCTRRSSPSHGFSRQWRISTSIIEEPARSMTRKPVRSMIGDTGSAMPACIRMPHRLCWPSRIVSSRNSTWAMTELLSFSKVWKTLVLQPARGDPVFAEIGMRRHEGNQRQGCLGTFQAEIADSLQSALDRLATVPTLGDQLADHGIVEWGHQIAHAGVGIEPDALTGRRRPGGYPA